MPEKLEFGQMYHIYNRGVNRCNLFHHADNYKYFLRLLVQHIWPIAYIYAYCLMPNHFHFLLRLKDEAEIKQAYPGVVPKAPHQYFSNWFNAYTRSFNPRNQRTGSLFQRPFGRKPVLSERYFYNLIIYIHQNPQHHGLVDDFRDWPWSSYGAILGEQETKVAQTTVLDWFGNKQEFALAHQQKPDELAIDHLILDDFF
jgi:REP element-mobilizing transposase RayT